MSTSKARAILVLARDSASGLYRVGWLEDMPPWRYEAFEALTETDHCHPLGKDSPIYPHYTRACERARALNQPLLEQQCQQMQQQGCLPLANELTLDIDTHEDDFGCLRQAAMQQLFRLTANQPEVVAAIQANQVIQLISRQPSRPLSELEFEVWRQHCIKQLSQCDGELLDGRLRVEECGLWFQPYD